MIPLFGFYLQPAVGGRVLPYEFWRGFAEIENVVAIKMAPFNRYQTIDVVRAVAESGRAGEIALYTGNDDNIVVDLLTPFRFGSKPCASRAVCWVTGRSGRGAWWNCWIVSTKSLSGLAGSRWRPKSPTPTPHSSMWPTSSPGCIAGIHEVLRRQGLLAGRWCLNPAEDLSPGQMEEIDRVYAAYPHLNDDDFVRQHLDEWLK